MGAQTKNSFFRSIHQIQTKKQRLSQKPTRFKKPDKTDLNLE